MAECQSDNTYQPFLGQHSSLANDPSVCLESLSSNQHEDHIFGQTDTSQQSDDSSLLSTVSGTLDDLDMDSLHTHCKCPCGNTNLLHCIESPPKCLARRNSNPQQFPELELTSGIDRKKARMAVRQHFSSETKHLEDIFSTYAMAVYNFAKSIKEIESSLKQLLRFKMRVDHGTISDFDGLYNAVTEGTDFLNPEPLHHVLKQCNFLTKEEISNRNRENARAAEKKFNSTFQKFAKLRVFSLKGGLEVPRLPIQEGVYKRLKIKIEENLRKFLGKRIFHFKKVVRNTLNIPEQVHLRVISIKEGCVELIFDVIGNVPDEVFRLDMAKKQALVSNKISMLEYAGKVQYCCCTFFKETDEASITIVKDLYCRDIDNDMDEESLDHSPDCPSLQNKKLECPRDRCMYCKKEANYCILEFHLMECDQRGNTPDRPKSVQIKEQDTNPASPGFKAQNVASCKTKSGSTEGNGGLAFRFPPKLQKTGLSLRVVSIDHGVPVLHFTSTENKVPTITEEDVAICIQLSENGKRPELFSYSKNQGILTENKLCFEPANIKNTSLGELFAEIYWNMQCFNTNSKRVQQHQVKRSPYLRQEKTIFNSQNIQLLTCKSVHIVTMQDKLIFEGEPRLGIDGSEFFSQPSPFLKMKEIIKLMLSVEWLRDKGIKFDFEWIIEHLHKPKRFHNELGPLKEKSLQQLQAGIDCAVEKLDDPFACNSVKPIFPLSAASKTKCNSGLEFQLEYISEHTYWYPPESLTVPVTTQMTARITPDDYTFLLLGNDDEIAQTSNESMLSILANEMPFIYKQIKDLDTKQKEAGCSISEIPVTELCLSTASQTETVKTIKASMFKVKKVETFAERATCTHVDEPLKCVVFAKQFIDKGAAKIEMGDSVMLCMPV